MKTLLLLLAFSAMAIAEDCTNCTPEIKPFENVIKNVENLQAAAVINCKEKLKDDAKSEYQNLFGNLPKQQQKIKGIKLEGSALELNYLSKMLGEKPMDRWSLARDCKTVLCAITKIYDSEETAHRVLNIAKRDGYIVSAAKDWQFENSAIGQLFTPGEIKDIDLAYKKLPHSFKKLGSLDRLKRLPEGKSSPRAPQAAAYASPGFHSQYFNIDGEITFLDGGFSGDESWGPFVAVHELTHHFDYSSTKDFSLGISEGATYLKMSGWKKKQKYETDKTTGKKTQVTEWEHSPDKKFVTDYAGTQPAEDFAESAAFYVFHPEKLKSTDPEKYDFLKKNVFKDKEYTTEVELPLPTNELLRLCVDSNKEYRMYNLEYLTTSISPSCLNEYIKDFKITDPALCSLNMKQIKNIIFDKMSSSISHLNEALKKCDQELPGLKKECRKEGNFEKSCAAKKYFDKNALSSSQFSLTETETKELQERLLGKIKLANFAQEEKTIKTIENNLGKNNFLSVVLINGLANKDKIHNQFSLTRQGDFLKNANDGLGKKLVQQGYKFDSEKDLEDLSQYYLQVDKEVSASIDNFHETVLKKATKSKEKNLELIKAWAGAQSLEDTPMFEELAESLRKYGGFKLPWK